MLSFVVGEKFPLNIKILYPGDYFHFDVIQNTIILAYFLELPSFTEIDSMMSGKYNFAVTETEGIMFFLSKFGKMEWSDVAINYHMITDNLTAVPDENNGYPISFMTVDRTTGIIKTMRVIGLGCEFSKEIKTVLERNKNYSYDGDMYRRIVPYVYSRYSTLDLLKRSVTYSREFISMHEFRNNLNKISD